MWDGGEPWLLDALGETSGYYVDTTDGFVGVLERVERDEDGRPLRLVIGQGWFRRQYVTVPVEALVRIDHTRHRAVLAAGSASLDGGIVVRLADRTATPVPIGDPAGPAITGRLPERPVVCVLTDPASELALAAELAGGLGAPLVLGHAAPSAGGPARPDGGAHLVLAALVSRAVLGLDVVRLVGDVRSRAQLADLVEQLAVRLVVASPEVIGDRGGWPCPVVLPALGARSRSPDVTPAPA